MQLTLYLPSPQSLIPIADIDEIENFLIEDKQ